MDGPNHHDEHQCAYCPEPGTDVRVRIVTAAARADHAAAAAEPSA